MYSDFGLYPSNRWYPPLYCLFALLIIFKQSVGISVPRVSKEQSKYGQFVNRSDLQVGDIVCFDTEDGNNGNVSHSGIYIGNGEFIHASSAKGKVIISNMSSGFYSNAYVNARRVL